MSIAVKAFNRHTVSTMKPLKNTIIIRTTSDDDFIPLVNENFFTAILEIPFDDASENHPQEDLKYGVMTEEHYFKIKKFILKYKDSIEHIICSCDAAQSRSPALALGILDYILEDHNQATMLVKTHLHWKPNSHVLSFFKKDYYQQL